MSQAPQVQEEPAQACGRYEPSLFMVKLPRCPNPDCPDPVHPLARADWYDPKICPGCGGPAAEAGEVQEVEDVNLSLNPMPSNVFYITGGPDEARV